jgi:hypothetical protein
MLIFLVGCEVMPDPGNFSSVLKPVDVAAEAAPAPAAPAEAAPEPVPEPAPEPAEEHAAQDHDGGTAAELALEPTTPAQPEAAQAQAPAEAVEDTTGSDSSTSPDASKEADSAGTAAISVANNWPLRLVKTMPETNPPRAILGLPTGEEIVVNPGTMIPAHRLVVTSIGPRTTDLVLIEPQGDHTAISAISLQTQY